jgi:hypothetical protein
MVAVFCGKVLPLDSEIMRRGSLEERREHLLEVLGVFLHERINKLFEKEAGGEEVMSDTMNDEETGENDAETAPAERELVAQANRVRPISEEEVDSFLDFELKLLDNKHYFKAVFE